MYKELLAKSWKDLKQNRILIVPNLIYGIFMFASGFFFLAVSGLLKIAMHIKALEGDQEKIQAYLQTLSPDIILAILGYGMLWITILIVGFFLARAITLGMMGDLMREKKPTLRNAGIYLKNYFWKLVALNLVITFFFLLVGVVGSIPAIIVFLAVGKSLPVLAFFILLLIGICAILGSFWIYGIFFLSKQVVICEQATVGEAMKESKRIFSAHTKGIIKSIFLMLGVGLLSNIILSILKVIPVGGAIINYASVLILAVWLDLFMFHVYKVRKELK